MRALDSKIVSFDQLRALCNGLHEKKLKIVTTNGCFDLLHWGHIKMLSEARALGNVLICGVNSDRSVKKLKGDSRPVWGESIRVRQVAAIEAVDYAVIFDQETPEELIRTIRPTIHAKGGDYILEKLPEKNCVESCGGKIVLLPYLEGFSTTALLRGESPKKI